MTSLAPLVRFPSREKMRAIAMDVASVCFMAVMAIFSIACAVVFWGTGFVALTGRHMSFGISQLAVFQAMDKRPLLWLLGCVAVYFIGRVFARQVTYFFVPIGRDEDGEECEESSGETVNKWMRRYFVHFWPIWVGLGTIVGVLALAATLIVCVIYPPAMFPKRPSPA